MPCGFQSGGYRTRRCLAGRTSLTPDGQYVDLLLNPERFTGYAGDSAHNVWRAIYEENCFGLSEAAMDAANAGMTSSSSVANVLGGAGAGGIGFSKLSEGWGTEMIKGAGRDNARDDVCEEKRVYYRVISGESIVGHSDPVFAFSRVVGIFQPSTSPVQD